MKLKELKPIVDTTTDFEKIERRIKAYFRKYLYEPLLRELKAPQSTIRNAKKDPILEALADGRIYFEEGAVYGGSIPRLVFKGKFDAEITKALKALGAKWHKKSETFRVGMDDVPAALRASLVRSQAESLKRVAKVAESLTQKLPGFFAESKGILDFTDIFDSSLWKTSREIDKTLGAISLPPELTPERRQRIAAEWQDNMDLWIKDFAEEEIVKLRKSIQRKVFSGDRYGSAVKSIQKSYGVTAAKAKFLARQETSLLLAKFKEVRYTEANVLEYRWKNVAGSKLHPVRPSHKILDGKIFKWSDPPITTAPNQPARRNNPGQDFGCRCTAIPIVRFQKEKG